MDCFRSGGDETRAEAAGSGDRSWRKRLVSEAQKLSLHSFWGWNYCSRRPIEDSRHEKEACADQANTFGAYSLNEAAMASMPIHSLRVENLETRLGLRRFVCMSLELEIELAQTEASRQILAHSWAEAMKGCRVLQLALDLLQREEESGQ